MGRCLLLILAALSAVAGEPANPFDQADVVLLVRDGRWVEREATRFAAGLGGDPALVRGELARSLWRCRGFEGIDLGRPALLAWRSGKAPFLAAIPVANRNTFLANFGEVEVGEPPLVRTGERDGGVIYTQNMRDGLVEYRMLVIGDTAYLSRSLDECRRMAQFPLPITDLAAPPLEMRLRGPSVRRPRPPGWTWIADLPPLSADAGELFSVPGVAELAWNDLSAQLTALTITARSNALGDLQLSVRATARTDSQLAQWLSSQRPAAERLPGQLRRAGTEFLACAHLVFQGQLERWGLDLAERLKSASGARWTSSIDASYRNLCGLAERSGALAVAVERQPGGSKAQIWAIEHPRSAEVAQYLTDVAATLRGSPATPVAVGSRPGTSWRCTPTTTAVVATGERHVVRIDARPDQALPAAEDVLSRTDEPGNLDSPPTLISAWADLSLVWNAPVPAEAERPEPVLVSASLRPAGPAQIELAINLPIQRFAILLGILRKTVKE